MSRLGKKEKRNISPGTTDLEARAKGVKDLQILTQLLLGH